jgi:hypothetical protein
MWLYLLMTAKHRKATQTDFSDPMVQMHIRWQNARMASTARFAGETALHYRHRVLANEADYDPKYWALNR